MPDSITITVRDDHLSHIEELADQLCAAGMRVRHVLSTVGIITGEVTSGQRSAIYRVPGVTSVEDQRVFLLPPGEMTTCLHIHLSSKGQSSWTLAAHFPAC
jgi:hypothetical protein